MRDTNDAVTVSVRMSAAMRDELAFVLRRQGTTISEHLRRIVAESLESQAARVPVPPVVSTAERARQLLQSGGDIGGTRFVADEEAMQFEAAHGFQAFRSERRYRDTIVALSRAYLMEHRFRVRVESLVEAARSSADSTEGVGNES